MAQLREAFGFKSRRVDALDAIDKSGACGKQGSVVVDPHLHSSGLQALPQFFHQGIVAPIDIGVTFCAHDGYFNINR